MGKKSYFVMISIFCVSLHAAGIMLAFFTKKLEEIAVTQYLLDDNEFNRKVCNLNINENIINWLNACLVTRFHCGDTL